MNGKRFHSKYLFLVEIFSIKTKPINCLKTVEIDREKQKN